MQRHGKSNRVARTGMLRRRRRFCRAACCCNYFTVVGTTTSGDRTSTKGLFVPVPIRKLERVLVLVPLRRRTGTNRVAGSSIIGDSSRGSITCVATNPAAAAIRRTVLLLRW